MSAEVAKVVMAETRAEPPLDMRKSGLLNSQSFEQSSSGEHGDPGVGSIGRETAIARSNERGLEG